MLRAKKGQEIMAVTPAPYKLTHVDEINTGKCMYCEAPTATVYRTYKNLQTKESTMIRVRESCSCAKSTDEYEHSGYVKPDDRWDASSQRYLKPRWDDAAKQWIME